MSQIRKISLMCVLMLLSFLIGLSIAQEPMDGLRDIKGPVNFPVNFLFYFLLFILIALAGVVIWYLYVHKKRAVVPVLSQDTRLPWEIAYESLDELERSGLLSEGKFKTYYSSLSGIIRAYFENRFGIKAPEMTTEEFLWSLEKSQHLKTEQKNTLKNFLNSCDIVKFAKYTPVISEGKESFQLARGLIDETKLIEGQASSNS